MARPVTRIRRRSTPSPIAAPPPPIPIPPSASWDFEIELPIRQAPETPRDGYIRLFARAGTKGELELCAIFPSGDIVQIANG